MAKTLAELMADAQSADDLTFAGPDGLAIKLSDLRGIANSTASEKAALAAKIKEAEGIGNEAREMYKKLELALKNVTPEKLEDKKPEAWRDDPLYAPLAPIFDQLKAVADGAKSEVATLKKNLDQSQAIFALERMRRQWAEAKSKPKDAKFEDIVANVLKSQELDEYGLPTIEKYLYRSTESDRIKAAQDEAVASAKKTWEEEQRLKMIPKPANTRFNVKDKGAAPVAKLEDITSDLISKDPDILKAMETPV